MILQTIQTLIVKIAFPLQLAAQGAHLRLFVEADQGAQCLVNDLAPGFETSHLKGALDEFIIQNNVGAHDNLFVCINMLFRVYYIMAGVSVS